MFVGLLHYKVEESELLRLELFMKKEKRFIIEIILILILLPIVMGVGYLSFEILLKVFTQEICVVIFIAISSVFFILHSVITENLDK